MYRAGPALTETATKLRTGEIELVAQDVQQRRRRLCRNRVLRAVDQDFEHAALVVETAEVPVKSAPSGGLFAAGKLKYIVVLLPPYVSLRIPARHWVENCSPFDLLRPAEILREVLYGPEDGIRLRSSAMRRIGDH